MKQDILKNRLTDLIGESKVKAAMFYTFNFEPEFFENYVMPILLPGIDFTNNKIQNAILWRRYKNEGIVPPITVYYDEKVKNIDYAPHLGYNVVGMRLKGAHFHPKNSFILTNDNRLIILTGSNNISAAGWNTNLEGITEFVLKPNEFFPQDLKNIIWSYIEDVLNLNNPQKDKKIRGAEEMIISFLKKRKFAGNIFPFYYSLQRKQNFEDFLKYNIPSDIGIYKLEVVSPFFSPNTELIEKIKSIYENIEIKCLAPNNIEDYLEIEREVFDKYLESGVRWCRWKSNPEKTMRVHSKIYRFYNNNKVYNVIGSVNFTEHAWGINEKKNVECAILIEESNTTDELLRVHDFGSYKFVNKQDNQEDEKNIFNIFYPELSFIIDWKENTLEWENNEEDLITLNLPDDENKRLSAISWKSIYLNKKQLSKYADNPIIKVTHKKNILYYYPEHLNIEFKPLSSRFRFSDIEILKIWNSFGDKSKLSAIEKIGRIIEKFSDEEGEIDTEKLIESESTLNKMAMNLSALVNLERFLISNKDNLNEIKYYLTTENPDSLPFYLKELKKKHEDTNNRNGIRTGFYWLILKIILKKFYKNKIFKSIDIKSGEDITQKIKEIKVEIKQELKSIQQTKLSNIDKNILKWAEINI